MVATTPALRTVAVAVLLAVLPAASARARVHTIAPPGNSGVNQYVESVPTAKGSQPTSTIHPQGGGGGSGRGPGAAGSGGTSSGAGVIPASTARALSRLGTTGAAAAAFALATAPRRVGHRARPVAGTTNQAAGRTASSGGSAATSGGSAPTSSVVKALTGSASGDTGLGVLLPVILVVSALAAAAMSIARRRRTT